ncbi:hypothetical protein ONZ43_g5490 [Nemania bipapillata]|uniref:Uncharacterized protein n=1 Tax=Nemania bipapillata TaxID=110536 RepID=A0ACC2IA23_9PEZI|nr:hypothetical protein ONZ43_g5490 [Nemania bipapillata]
MALLDINPEGRLDKEIEDIIEELDIMIHLANTHNDILRKFVAQSEHILNPRGEFKKNTEFQPYTRSGTNSPLSGTENEKEVEREKRATAYRSFKQKANEVQARALDHIKELEKLRQSAKKTAEDVLHLLEMKQQQASVFQAWQAMKQSDETIKQGQSIMTFTLVTIVFLPLSFLSSVFGMNNKEFGSGSWNISRQIIYIFSISAGVVFFSLLLAFSSWIRAFIWSFYVRTSTAGAVRSGVYDIYLNRPTERIYEDAARTIYRAKRDRRNEYFDRRWKKREAKDQLLQEVKGPEEEGIEQHLIGGLMANIKAARWLPGRRNNGNMPSDVSLESGTQQSTNGKHGSSTSGTT